MKKYGENMSLMKHLGDQLCQVFVIDNSFANKLHVLFDVYLSLILAGLGSQTGLSLGTHLIVKLDIHIFSKPAGIVISICFGITKCLKRDQNPYMNVYKSVLC